jgi:hypothetical protein
MFRRSLVLAACLGLFSASVSAEDVVTAGPADHRASEFSLQPGIALFTGDASDYHDNSFSLDGQWLWGIHDVAKIGPEVGYIFGSEINGTMPGRLLGQGDSVSFRSDVKSRILHLTPVIKIGPVIDVHGFLLNPYVIGGGGYYWTHYTEGTGNATGVVNGVPVANSPVPFAASNDHNGGFNIGVGTSIMLPQNFGLGFELRHHKIIYKGDDVSWITPSARLTFYFR